jgi:hypothetical protein
MRAVMLALATVVAVTVGTGRGMALAAQAGGEVAEIVAKTREALGGGKRLKALTTVTAEGPFRRSIGDNAIGGTIRLTLGVPGRIRHEEELDLPTGARVTRLAGFNGEHVWEDTATRGGIGGGQIIIRGSGPSMADRQAGPEQVREALRRGLISLSQRMTLALLAQGDDLSYGGIAQVGDSEAHVLEITDQAGHPVRLFISSETHMPIAVSYMEVRPVAGSGGRGMTAMGAGGPAGGPGGQGQVRQIQALPPSTIVMRLEDYRTVDGIRLPHLFVQTADGEPIEEWTIRRYRVNPRVNARVFDRK